MLFAEAVGLDTSRYSYFPAFAKIRINWRYVISCKLYMFLIYDEQNVVYLFSLLHDDNFKSGQLPSEYDD